MSTKKRQGFMSVDKNQLKFTNFRHNLIMAKIKIIKNQMCIWNILPGYLGQSTA
jgi:hypothetical protein